IKTFSEMIYGLPGESYESFIEGVIATVRQKATIAIYPMLLIEGAENFTNAHRRKFGIKTKKRVIPRYISTMPGIHTIEYEEVGIENDSLPMRSWLKIREFHFLLVLFTSSVFIDLKEELEAHDLDYATLSKLILDDKGNWPNSFAELMDDFRDASVSELLEPNEIKPEYDPDEFGDIELKYPAQNYYFFAVLSCSSRHLDDFCDYLNRSVDNFFGGKLNLRAISGLKVAIELCFDMFICYEKFEPEKSVTYNIDIYKWKDDAKNPSVNAYRSDSSFQYDFKIDKFAQDRFEELQSTGLKLNEVVYKLRNSFIGYKGNPVFSYIRTKKLVDCENEQLK
ncbi:MAG: hypothetical protein GXP02_09020, partial [Alphaproteobacteria bacterium]|nr:hypothetical protein [Alphaproteobacteria bacterium]